jgi:hypothetical protein
VKPWDELFGLTGRIVLAGNELRRDVDQSTAELRASLTGGQQRPALVLLSVLGGSYTVALVPQVVAASLSHRDALLAREVLGRLAHRDAANVVPAAVWQVLAQYEGDDAYRRLAELLDHLGLRDTLDELCSRALASDDADVREVGEDYGGE